MRAATSAEPTRAATSAEPTRAATSACSMLPSGCFMTSDDDPAIEWLLASREPAIRLVTRRDLLGDHAPPDEKAILDGPIVSALLADQRPDGGFGVHPYSKWSGAHWRLVSLSSSPPRPVSRGRRRQPIPSSPG